jgi:6-phosphogluconate dehydrogenase (decarboxylating)
MVGGQVEAFVADSGEGRWTVVEANEQMRSNMAIRLVVIHLTRTIL